MMTDPAQTAFSPGRERLILLVLAAVQFTSIVDFVVLMPLYPELKQSLGLTPAQFGLVVSSYTYAAGLAGLFATMLLDRIARRTAFLTLFGGFLAGTVACGLAPSYGALLAARFLTGAFGGIIGGLALAIIGDVFREERRGAATGALMSAFALASVVGVPAGLKLGQEFGWHVPFITLGCIGLPILLIAAKALPAFDGHVAAARARTEDPWERLRSTFTEPNHLRAFALTVTLMFSSFAVVPFLSLYLVANVKVAKDDLMLPYIAGGILTLISSPITGRLADRYGKLRVYRCVAPALAVLLVIVTNLPPSPLIVAVLVVALMTAVSAARMVPAMAMITSSVVPHRRGGFLAANAAVQHISLGLGASAGGQILTEAADGTLKHYGYAGALGVLATMVSLWLAGRLRLADSPETAHAIGVAESLAAAAQGTVDADEPITVAEM